MIKSVLYIFLGIVLILICAILYMANPWAELNQTVKNSSTENLNQADTIRILSFNMAYGYGVGSDGVGYKPKEKDEILARLNNIALLLDDYHIDLALLQEVDFDADRSGNLDQAAYLSEQSQLKNYASAVSWNANYVPFPYSPVSHQFGKVKSGGAVLSRFPIAKQEVTILEKPKSNAWWYNLFYLHRYIQKVQIQHSSFAFQLLNMHLEAYDVSNKEDQALHVQQLIKQDSNIVLFGGDMNSLPDFANQKSDFDDAYGDDYRNDRTQSILRAIDSFAEPKDSIDDPRFYTFPPLNPNRQLDYLFVKNGIEVLSYEVIDTGDLSDHRPILLTIRITKN